MGNTFRQIIALPKMQKVNIYILIILFNRQTAFQQCPIFIFRFGSKNSYNSNQKGMKECIVATLTGFTKDPQEQAYKKLMMSLNIRHAPNLSEQTKVLIVNDVTTQKYKIAKTYQVPITCVSIDWLHESSSKNKILPTLGFQIKKLFYGAYVKLVGFDQEKSKKMELRIIENGGFASSIKNNNQLVTINREEQKISVILTTKEYFIKLKPYLDKIDSPIVDVEWVEDSIRNKFCKYPFDYALNQTLIRTRDSIEHLHKMKKKLELQLSIDPIDKLQNKIFENCFIYINVNINGEFATLLKKLIMVFGGFYLDELSPAVTHLLTESVTEQEYYQLKIYGALINILRIDWLIDSIYINRKMKEEDYIIRSFRSKLSSTLHLEEMQNNMNFNSMTYNSFGFGTSVPIALNNRKSISVVSKVNQQNLKQKQIRIVKKLQSTIFKDYCFYIDSTQKKQIQLCDLTNKIIKNGGQIFTSRAQIRKGHCFYVMKDSLDATKMIQRLKKDTRGESRIQPVSYRWVNQCLNRTQFIDITKVDSYIYKPFNFKTPIHGFHKIIFQVLGLDDFTRMRLKELYNALGSAKNVANKVEITHCLCGKTYQQTTKFKEIKKQNTTVKFLNWKWLIECANLGKIAGLEDFYMEKENVLSTQQSQNSNLVNIVAIEHPTLQTA